MKYSKRYIFYTFLSSLPIVFVVPIVMMAICTTSPEDSDEIIFNNILGVNDMPTLVIWMVSVSVAVAVVLFVLSYLSWLKTTYTVGESSVDLTAGVVFRRNVSLPYSKIHAITVDRPLFLRFFGMSKLALDSGNTAAQNNEIVIFDTETRIKELESQLHLLLNQEKPVAQIKDDGVQNVVDYKFDPKLRLTYLYSNIWVYVITLVALGVGIFLAITGLDLVTRLMVVILPLGALVLYCSIALIALTIRYSNYSITLKGDEIVVSFGLLDKKRVVIQKNKIKAISIKRDLVQMLTGYCSITAEIVGLKATEDQSEIAVTHLIPFVKYSEASALISIFGDNYRQSAPQYKASKKALPFFLAIPVLVILTVALPFIIAFAIIPSTGLTILASLLLYITVFLIAVTLLLCILTKRNQGVSMDDDNLYLEKGTLVKTSYIIPWKNVVSINSFATPIRQKYGVTSLVVSTYTSKLDAKKTVSMVDEEAYSVVLNKFLEKK